MNRSDQLLTHLYYPDPIHVVNRREGLPVKNCKMGSGIYEVLNVRVKRFKVDLRFLQEVRRKVFIPHNQVINSVFAAEITDLCRIFGVVGSEKIKSSFLDDLPVPGVPRVGKFVRHEGLSAAKGKHIIHQVRWTGHKTCLGG